MVNKKEFDELRNKLITLKDRIEDHVGDFNIVQNISENNRINCVYLEKNDDVNTFYSGWQLDTKVLRALRQ